MVINALLIKFPYLPWRRIKRQLLLQWFMLFLAVAYIFPKCIAIVSRPPPRNSILQGHLEVGGQRFLAVCDCRPPRRGFGVSVESVLCNPSKIAISVDHGEKGLDPETIRKVYGQPRDIEMVDETYQKFSCMDDRITEPSLMTPGGDLGEFLLNLFVFTHLNNIKPLSLDEDAVTNMLIRFIEGSPPSRLFYHCNDDDAISHIEREVGIVGLDLAAPAQEKILTLKEKLKDPKNHGDIHIRSILSHPDRYHLPLDLVKNTISSFYRLLWDSGSPVQSRLMIDILPGNRSPQAFIEVDEGDACTQAQKAPLFRPKMIRHGQTTSAFIIHTSAISHRRREAAQFILSEVERLGNAAELKNITTQDIYGRLDKYGLQWLEATVSAVAADLKFYKMIFQ